MPHIALLAARNPESIVAWRGASPVRLARFLGDVAQTAARLPSREYVMNLCSDRYRFMVALAAALCRGQVSLLPPSAAPEVLARIGHAHGEAHALVDPGAQFPGLEPGIPVDASGSPADGDVPSFDPGQLAVVAFTSGSTGQSVPQSKTWGSLAQGAAEEAAGLGLDDETQVTLLGTVPPQHMYGLESTVVLALRGGFAIHAGRPLYPADIAAALFQVPSNRVLVTTPVHLRALLAEDIELPALRLIVCATAPLPMALAAQAETRYGASLREIYGFTEAGMVATRRTARHSQWRTLPGVRAQRVGAEVCFSGGHVEREVAASDVIELIDEQTFVLRGRGVDLVNVAGKRTSLAYLNHALCAVDGVDDGVFFMPDDTGAKVIRPIAFVVAPQLSRETLLAGLRERIDPVFLPRPLHFVEALPRNATGKLSRETLVGLAAECAARPAASAAVRLLAPDHPVAQGHFPGNPIVPGAVILDHVIRVAEARMGLAPCAWVVSSAKFLGPVRPGEDLRIQLAPRQAREASFACFVGTRSVASGRLRALDQAPDDPAEARR